MTARHALATHAPKSRHPFNPQYHFGRYLGDANTDEMFVQAVLAQ